jgi:predicted small secreted protein
MKMEKLVALILLVAISGLSACNTIEGAGSHSTSLLGARIDGWTATGTI